MPKSLRLVHCLLFFIFSSASVLAQQPDTTKPTSVDPDLLAIPQSKTPKEYVLAGIVFTGTKAYDQSLLTSISGLNIGDKVVYPGGDNFSHAIQNLWKQNLFANVQIYFTRIDGKDIYIEIHVVERPRLGSFTFKGVKKGQEDDLKTKTGLVKGRVVLESTKLTAIENIEKYFTEKGFKSATIKIDEKIDPNVANSVNLTFYITKGNKVRINQVNIFGNETVTEGKLKKQLKGTKEAMRMSIHPSDDKSVYGTNKRLTFKEYVQQWGFLSPTKTMDFIDPYFRFKLSSAKFSDKKYIEDKAKLLEYYNSLGYRDATIEADTIYYNQKGNLNVDIKIQEGHKYYFGNIAWKGNTKYPDSILNAILGIKKGDVYNLETLNRRIGKQVTPEGGDISGLYQDDGYLFFRADPIETAVYNDTIDHEIRLVEGPQATIKNVTISGNEKTKEYVIRRELRTIPGEKFSRSDVIRTNREIAQLGYFNQEKINPNIVPNQDDGTVDINWGVEEKSSDQLELSAGWGGGIGLTGTLGVSFNNFSIRNIFKKSSWDPLPTGDGQKLSVRVQSNGRAFRSYNASFTEPWLGGKKRNSLTFSAASTKYSNSYDYATGTYSKAAGDTSFLKSLSFSVALGKQLKWPDDFFTLVYQLNYTQYNLKNYPGFFRLSDGTNLSNGKSNNISIKVSLSRSSIDQPLFPRSGSSFTLSGQFTPPYSLFNKSLATSANPYKFVEFHKWRFNGEWYVPLGRAMGEDRNKQFVLKAAAKYGFMGRYNSKLDYSPFERFQLGDAGLSNNYGILGYDIISQRGYPIYTSSDPRINPDQNSTSQFFTLFNKYVLELRYPFSTNPSSTIYGLAFFEAANGWYNYKDYNPFRLRRSAGLGMRFFLPMFGLLGFDYGVGLDRLQPGVGLKGAAKFTFLLGFEPE
ncbi:MAG: POTRA domain-containing protein [Chitinophagaceae bacterium]